MIRPRFAGLLANLAFLFLSGVAGAADPTLATAANPGGGLLPKIERALAAKEYEASPNRRGLQAPNRAHDLRTYFEPSGIRVHARTAPGSPELLALQLTGVGRGERLEPASAGEVASRGARVEIRREGLLEWYENSPAGLEQGFTLEERPEGTGPVVLELALGGATASHSAGDLVFVTGSGRRLRYGALQVRDAGGRSLAARFELPSPQRLRIAVEDAGATYPLVVDPLLTSGSDSTVESNQDFANFGTTVASAGDVNGDGYADVIVGAVFYDDGENDEGAAFVFHGGPGGIASGGPLVASAKIVSDQALANMRAVAGAGDVNGDGYDDIIVGAHAYDAGEGFLEGIALVFHGGPSGVGDGSPANADATLESNVAGVWFGVGVAGAGDVNGDGYADVIVGAHQWNDRGAAFIFHGSASGIADGSPATADTFRGSVHVGGQFGLRVASAGDVNGDGYGDVIIGADLFGATDEGAAFVFQGSASGIADGFVDGNSPRLSSNQAGAFMGQSVASAGDVNGDGYSDVIVGADAYNGGSSGEGAAFIFHGGPTGISSGDPATADGRIEANQADAQLGRVVAGAGDVNGDGYADVIVGAPLYDAGASDSGLALVFLGSVIGFGNVDPSGAFAQLTPGQADARMGEGVASAGDVNGDGYADVIVGAYTYDSGNSDEGAAFVYHGGAHGILDGSPTSNSGQLEGNQTSAQLGYSVAGAGDVNGDGYSDVIVGANFYDAGQSDEGAAFIYLGSEDGFSDGLPGTPATQLESNQADAQLGSSVAGAGDVNGDGYDDVIVGAYVYDSGEFNEGAAFVFHGSPSGVASGNPSTAAARLEGNGVDASFGISLAGAGDVNGDGFGDVIIGANGYENGQGNEGGAFLFLGSASGIADGGSPSTAATRLESNQVDGNLGMSVAGAGDVNGDGFADVIVGANLYDAGQTDEGAAFVFHGSSAGIPHGSPSSAATQLESGQPSSNFGESLAGAGDVNGDGYADVIVGARTYEYGGNSDEGTAFIFHGSAAGIDDGDVDSADSKLFSAQNNADFGHDVAGAGDVNGDGYADVIVGSYMYDAGQSNEGAAFVFLGGSDGVADAYPSTAAAQLEANQANERMGYSVAGAGDVNGDGFADVIVGAYGYTVDLTDEGIALLFHGGGNLSGRPVFARQLRGSGTLAVQPWGASYTADFRVRAVATHPAGRGRVKLEVQACPPAVDFGNPSYCTTSISPTWTDVTASGAGVTLTQTLSVYGDDILYHWRARVLHAPFTVTQAGITASPNPSHGPWRRLHGQALEADLRVRLDSDFDGTPNSSDTDDDGDGIGDLYETDTGIYVSPTNTGTDPLDNDSDDDGLLDGAEVTLGTDPNDPDHDGDGDLDGADNCPLISNGSQANTDALPAGDACQCGNVDATGGITATDYQLAREAVVKTPGSSFYPDFCDVNGDAACDVEDLAILQRIVNAQPATVANACQAYLSP